jgi:hypothetical protein
MRVKRMRTRKIGSGRSAERVPAASGHLRLPASDAESVAASFAEGPSALPRDRQSPDWRLSGGGFRSAFCLRCPPPSISARQCEQGRNMRNSLKTNAGSHFYPTIRKPLVPQQRHRASRPIVPAFRAKIATRLSCSTDLPYSGLILLGRHWAACRGYKPRRQPFPSGRRILRDK